MTTTDKMVPVPRDQAEPIPTFDALTELLNMDSALTKIPEDFVDMSPRFRVPWKVRALDDTLNEKLLEEASDWKKNPRTGQQVRELNTQLFGKLVVYHCVVEPNLKDPKLSAKHGLTRTQHAALVRKLLLPGYIDRLSTKIMDLSGFNDNLVDVAKNSSEEED